MMGSSFEIDETMNKEELFKLLGAVAAFASVTFLIDEYMISIIPKYRIPVLNDILVFFEILSVSVICTILLCIILGIAFWKKNEERWLPFLFLSIGLSAVVAIGIQHLFARPRPEDIGLVGVTLRLWRYSFPSGHTAVAFSAVPILLKVLPKFKLLWFGFATTVAISRVYLGAHYISDVIFGAIIGYLIGMSMLNYEVAVKDREVRRQLFHAAMGVFLVISIYRGFFDQIGSYPPLSSLYFIPATSRTILSILMIGAVLIYTSMRMDIPIISWFLDHFERPGLREDFPGKGCFFFFVGAFIISLIFDNSIVAASLLILAIGDSTSHLIGARFGKIKHPFSRDKNIEGNIAGALLSGLLVSIILHPVIAFTTSFIVMFVEGIYFTGIFEKLNEDNLTIPILSAVLIFILDHLIAI